MNEYTFIKTPLVVNINKCQQLRKEAFYRNTLRIFSYIPCSKLHGYVYLHGFQIISYLQDLRNKSLFANQLMLNNNILQIHFELMCEIFIYVRRYLCLFNKFNIELDLHQHKSTLVQRRIIRLKGFLNQQLMMALALVEFSHSPSFILLCAVLYKIPVFLMCELLTSDQFVLGDRRIFLTIDHAKVN